MATTVQAVDINALKRFSRDARVNQLVLNSKGIVTRMNCYEPGQITPKHVHPDDDEIVFCIEGRGAAKFDGGETVPLTPGVIVNLPAGIAHWLEAAADSRMVVIYWANSNYTSIRMHSETGYGSVRLPGEQPPST
jgi:quercetin dioxygenase-like cupin family protein